MDLVKFTFFGIPGFHAEEESGRLAITSSDLRRKLKVSDIISYVYESGHDLGKANPTGLIISSNSDKFLGGLEIYITNDRKSRFAE